MRQHKILQRLISFLAAIVLTAAATESAMAGADTVRLAVVNTPHFSGLIDSLIRDFEAESALKVTVYSGNDVYDRARAGEADIVISHYGKPPVERFVLDGFGEWPRTVFANQAAIIGPKSDPAGIRGMTSATEAFAKIAKSGAPFIANDLAGVRYLTDTLWEEAGRPDKGTWYLETGVAKGKAIKFAEEKQGYVIFGAMPFLRFKAKHNSEMEIMVGADPLLQRVMASVLVNPEKVQGVNAEGAKAFQTYLLMPKTQAKIAAFRTPGSDQQLWWPAGRHNTNASDEAEGNSE